MFVVRAVVTELEEEGVYHAESRGTGLDAWLGSSSSGKVSVKLHVMKLRKLGLLVQNLPEERVHIVWEPLLRVDHVGEAICRFHEGPWGRPEEHRYCTRRAITREGYCELHKRSWRALYEKCAQGIDSACLSVAPLLRGYEFIVYVLDYGGSVAKAGLTQSWRLLWRISEQPHVAAAAVFRGELLEARELEKKLGRSPAATEGAAARLNKRLESAIATLRRGLRSPEKIAARLASMLQRLGFSGEFEAYTVLPRSGIPQWILENRHISLGDIIGKKIRIRDYWAGFLLVETEDTRLAIHKSDIQHLALGGVIVPRGVNESK